MKKADKKLLEDNLGKALSPPKKKPRQDLDALLDEYDDRPVTSLLPPPPLPASSPAIPSPTFDEVIPLNAVAPARDFNKRANSLDRMALPAGIFQGSSKKLYDALYVRTRGALVPKRSLRATKRELSDWSGIRNVKTIDSHLRYFSAIGLVISEWQRGQNDGSLYEVLLPEETSGLFALQSRAVTLPDPTSPHLTPRDVGSPQILGSPPPQNLGSPHLTDVPVISTTYSERKTSFKTKEEKFDDEIFAGLNQKLRQAAKEMTGKELSAAENERWSELGDVLVAELKIAAARTTVSNVPSFFAEHLRRRLWKVDKTRAAEIAAETGSEEEGIREAALSDEERRKCPDCAGVGFWYPEGTEKGVAKCKHARLHVLSPTNE